MASLYNLSTPPIYKLDADTRYELWEMRLKDAFRMRGVDCTLEADKSATPEQEAYARSLLGMNLSDANLLFINTAASVAEAMKLLREKYNGKVVARFFTLSHELNTIQKRADETIEQYMDRAVRLQTDLSIVKQPVTVAAVCAAILRGLPPEYKLVKEMLCETATDLEALSLSSLKTSLMRVEHDLLKGEGASTAPSLDQGSARAFQATTEKGRGQKRKERSALNMKRKGVESRICYSCGQRGHIAVNCPSSVHATVARLLAAQQRDSGGNGGLGAGMFASAL